jgi:hypothetical protein
MLKRLMLATALLWSWGCGLHTYQAVTVANGFELAQRHRQEWPEKVPLVPGDSHEAYFLKLAMFSTIPVMRAPPVEGEPDLWGRNYFGQLIYINRAMPLNTQVATLAHEIAHSLQPADLTEENWDYFAEAVSNIFCERIGLPLGDTTNVYFAISLKPGASEFILERQDEIDAVANAMLKAVQ